MWHVVLFTLSVFLCISLFPISINAKIPIDLLFSVFFQSDYHSLFIPSIFISHILFQRFENRSVSRLKIFSGSSAYNCESESFYIFLLPPPPPPPNFFFYFFCFMVLATSRLFRRKQNSSSLQNWVTPFSSINRNPKTKKKKKRNVREQNNRNYTRGPKVQSLNPCWQFSAETGEKRKKKKDKIRCILFSLHSQFFFSIHTLCKYKFIKSMHARGRVIYVCSVTCKTRAKKKKKNYTKTINKRQWIIQFNFLI